MWLRVRERWTRRDWGLLAIAISLLGVGAEPWTRTVWSVRALSGEVFELQSLVPGWNGLSFRTAALSLALASVVGWLLALTVGAVPGPGRAVLVAGLTLSFLAVGLPPLLLAAGNLYEVVPNRTGKGSGSIAGPSVTAADRPAAGYYLAVALLALAIVLAASGRRRAAAGPAGTIQQRFMAARSRVLLLLSVLLLTMSFFPWFLSRSTIGSLQGGLVDVSSLNAWQAATGWTAGVCLSLFAVLVWCAHRDDSRTRTLAVLGLVVAGGAMLWPYYRMVVPAQPSSGPTAIYAIPSQASALLPPFDVVPRNALTLHDDATTHSGPRPPAVAGLAILGAQLVLVLVPQRLTRARSAAKPEDNPSTGI